MIYLWLILILVSILLVIAVPYLWKELRNFINYSPKIEDFGHFPFTDNEWDYVEQKEFVEDEKGRKVLDKYFNIISYGKNTPENNQKEIVFTSEEIYLTDGKKGKSFTINRLNYVGNGFKLNSIDLVHRQPLKKLCINIDVIGVSPDSSNLDYSLEYFVPIPESALDNIDEILKKYGAIILNN